MSTKLYDISNWCCQGTELEDYPYVGEIDIDVSINSVVSVNENYYAVGITNPQKNCAGVRKVKIELEPEEKNYESNVICPYCGYSDTDSWELSDNEDEYQCGRCGAIIEVERIVTIEYNSCPKEPPKIVQANWI